MIPPPSQPLSAIAEHTLSGAEESEEEADDVAGGWRLGRSGDPANANANPDVKLTVLHSGYLWKKGAGRRKVISAPICLMHVDRLSADLFHRLADMEKEVVCIALHPSCVLQNRR